MRYRFGGCEVRPETRELLVDGVLRPVEPQVFDLVLMLLEARDRVVSKDELVERVWNGIVVSDSAISARVSAARSAIGDDGKRQALIRTVPRRGFRFVGAVTEAGDSRPIPQTEPLSSSRQRIGYCRSADGTNLACARSGSGLPLVRAGHWLTHLEHDWHSPLWRPMLDRLGQRFEVIRYDQRGNGLSDWDAADLTLDALVQDLEAVVDAARLDRFVLYGTSQGAPIAVAYAVRHPDRITHLILHGGFARGRLIRGEIAEREQAEAILTLIRHGWGRTGSAFIEAFAAMFIPEASHEQRSSLAELQRLTTSPANAARLREAVDRLDVSHLLNRVTVPTLVVHASGDAVQPLDEGKRLAAGIPGAEFVALDSRNHVIVPGEPAWASLFAAIGDFVAR